MVLEDKGAPEQQVLDVFALAMQEPMAPQEPLQGPAWLLLCPPQLEQEPQECPWS